MDGWQSGPQPLRRSDELCRCPNDSVRKLAELGIYGINFHDENFAPFGSYKATRDSNVSIFKKTLDEIGTKVPRTITNLFTQPFLRTVIDLQPKNWSIQNVRILNNEGLPKTGPVAWLVNRLLTVSPKEVHLQD